MHTLAAFLFLVQLTATLLMTGLIWFVQIVHYPLFACVGEQAFIPYARRHATLTGNVVGAPLLLELTTALAALAPALRPSFLPASAAWSSAALVVLIWIATGLLQVPLHERLGRAHDPRLIRKLVLGNWVRTASWTARSILLLSYLYHLL